MSLDSSGIVEHDWTAEGDWSSWLFTGFMAFSLAGGALWLSFQMWKRRTAKMDRVALLICIGFIAALFVNLAIIRLIPDAWEAVIDWVALLLLVWHAVTYRSVEKKWVEEGLLEPMPEGKPWPVMGKTWFGFIILMSLWGVLFEELGVTGYEGEEAFGFLFWAVALPAFLTFGILRWGRYGWQKRPQ